VLHRDGLALEVSFALIPQLLQLRTEEAGEQFGVGWSPEHTEPDLVGVLRHDEVFGDRWAECVAELLTECGEEIQGRLAVHVSPAVRSAVSGQEPVRP